MIFITKFTVSTLLKPGSITVLEDANDTHAKGYLLYDTACC